MHFEDKIKQNKKLKIFRKWVKSYRSQIILVIFKGILTKFGIKENI